MANKQSAERRVPFNLRGTDAEQFEAVRAFHESRLKKRLSAVKVVRILVGDAVKKLERKAAAQEQAS